MLFHFSPSSCKKEGNCLDHSNAYNDNKDLTDPDMFGKNESESGAIYKNGDNTEKEFSEEDSESIQFFFKRTQSYRNQKNDRCDGSGADEDSLTNSTAEDDDKTKTVLYKLCTLYVTKPKTIFGKYG